MKKFTLYIADCRENKFNTQYPNKRVIHNADELREAACFDQVFARYKDNHRSNDNFVSSDCLPFDCDNDHSDEPNDWVTPEKVAESFKGVGFYVVYSRHHMKNKGKRSARPRFHIIFPIDEITDIDDYKRLKQSVISFFPYFDDGAKDAARFFFGVKEPVVEVFGGDNDGT